MIEVLHRPGTIDALASWHEPLRYSTKENKNNHFLSIVPNKIYQVHKSEQAASASSTCLLLFLIEEGEITTISYCIDPFLIQCHGSHTT